MQYSNEFKERCSKYFLGIPSFPTLMKALEQKNDTLVRWCIEDGLDDPTLYENITNDDGELIILQAKQQVFKERQQVYSEWMEQFVIEVDKAVEYVEIA